MRSVKAKLVGFIFSHFSTGQHEILHGVKECILNVFILLLTEIYVINEREREREVMTMVVVMMTMVVVVMTMVVMMTMVVVMMTMVVVVMTMVVV